jgi:hypothetical protein
VYDDPAHAEQRLGAARKQEAEAFAAKASGNADEAVAKLKEAVAIEDSIDGLSQPPYPIIPDQRAFWNTAYGVASAR